MMQTVIPRLYASMPEALRFAPEFDIRAFLLARKQGNLLVCSVGALPSEAQSIKQPGGIWRHYLSHGASRARGSAAIQTFSSKCSRSQELITR
jgi:hypothetical protein